MPSGRGTPRCRDFGTGGWRLEPAGYPDGVLPVLKYTVMRLALFVVVLALLSWAGAGKLTAVVGAALVSALVSYLVLRGPRDEVARLLAHRVEARLDNPGRFGQGLREDEQVEDAAVDRAVAPDPARPNDQA